LKLKEILENKFPNYGAKAEWIWNEIKNQQLKKSLAHKIILNWYNDISRTANSSLAIHSKNNHLQGLFLWIDFFIEAKFTKNKSDIQIAEKQYNKIAQSLQEKKQKVGKI